MHIIEAARILRPGTHWNFDGITLTQAIDDCPRVTAPTIEECQAVVDANSYKELRQAEYPPLSDLADALVHQQMGDGGAALTTYLNACAAVKNKYPK